VTSRRRSVGGGLTVARAVLEASVGDWLHARGLGSAMAVVRNGREVALDAPSLRRAFRRPSARLTVWVHGLGVTERVWVFPGHTRKSYGTLHEAEAGVTPIFVRYNSGRRIADSGAALDALLERLVAGWPVPVVGLVLVGYSMGGLVVRSACHQGAERDAPWIRCVRRAVYLGVPHLGAPVEKAARAATSVLRTAPSRVARALGTLAAARSAGIQDLAEGTLRPTGEWLPLVQGVEHRVVLGTLHRHERHLVSLLLGDGMVRIGSASGRRRGGAPSFERHHISTVGGVGHLALPRSPKVYLALRGVLRAHADPGAGGKARGQRRRSSAARIRSGRSTGRRRARSTKTWTK
jgi:triacylglycerol lipase